MGADNGELGKTFDHSFRQSGGDPGGTAVEKVGMLGVGGGGTDGLEEIRSVDPGDFAVTGESPEPNKRHAVRGGEKRAIENLSMLGVASGTADGVGVTATDIVAVMFERGLQQDLGGTRQVKRVNSDS